MREVRRYFAFGLVLVLSLQPMKSLAATQSGLTSTATGAIVVDGSEVKDKLQTLPISLRVYSLTRHIDLTVTVGTLSRAVFRDLVPGDYAIEIAASGYHTGEIAATLAAGHTITLSLQLSSGSPPGFTFQPVPTDSSAEAQEPSTMGVLAATRASVLGANRDLTGFCPLQHILSETSKHLEEFVENINRINALEVLDHERLDKHGKVLEHERHQYNYIAIVEETSPGAWNVDEYRDGGGGVSGFPQDIATLGMPSLAMIFHPSHLLEFEMSCEGPAAWHTSPAWLVHFQQREDRPARMSIIRVGREVFPVLLKGTAWIDKENLQIIHLETDLMEPIPKAKLYLEHQALDYGPVHFETNGTPMWLPQNAEIFIDSGNKHFHHRHTYSKYQLFAVDVGQRIGDPKSP